LLPLQARIQGTIRFEVTTDRTGNVTSVTTVSENLLNRDRDRLFAEAVIESLKEWRFQGTNNVESKTTITYIFKIDGVASAKRTDSFVFDYPGTVTVTAGLPKMPDIADDRPL